MHCLSALLQLHLHSQHNTWLQWIDQRQLQDETTITEVFGFGVSYIRDLTVVSIGDRWTWMVLSVLPRGKSLRLNTQCWLPAALASLPMHLSSRVLSVAILPPVRNVPSVPMHGLIPTHGWIKSWTRYIVYWRWMHMYINLYINLYIYIYICMYIYIFIPERSQFFASPSLWFRFSVPPCDIYAIYRRAKLQSLHF